MTVFPAGATPNAGSLPVKIDPYDKYSRGVGLNPREEYELRGICKCGAQQLVTCYASVSLQGSTYNRLDFQYGCSECPYYAGEDLCYDPENRVIWNANWMYQWLMDKNYFAESNPKAFVYFISDGEYVKIGKRDHQSNRLNDLQTGNPRQLTTLFEIPLISGKAANATEKHLHKAFGGYRKNGEWFDILRSLNISNWRHYMTYATGGTR